MTDVHIVSNELNCYFAALILSTRGFRTAIDGRPAESTAVEAFGTPATAHITTPDALDGKQRIALVAAEGEDLRRGVEVASAAGNPDLFVIIGGGAAGVAEALDVAHESRIDPGRVLVVSAFIWGGQAGAPVVLNSEKLDLLAAFLAPAPVDAIELARRLAPTLRLSDPLTVALSSLNALIHPVPMILGATEIDRQSGARFFIDTFGDGVCRVAEQLDRERLALGTELGLSLPTFEEMLRTYYRAEGIHGDDLRTLVNTFHAYQHALIPESFAHRYLTHELAGNLSPMSEIGRRLSVPTPTLDSLIALGGVLAERDLRRGSSEVAESLLSLSGR